MANSQQKRFLSYRRRVAEAVDRRCGKFRRYAEVYWDLVPLEGIGYPQLASYMPGNMLQLMKNLKLDDAEEYWELLHVLKSLAWTDTYLPPEGGRHSAFRRRHYTFNEAWGTIREKLINSVAVRYFELQRAWRHYDIERAAEDDGAVAVDGSK